LENDEFCEAPNDLSKSSFSLVSFLTIYYCRKFGNLTNISKNQNMQKEKWINTLLFETALFDFTHLSNEENFILRRYLQDKKTPEQIAKMESRSVQEVKKMIRSGIKKVLSKSKEVLAVKIWFQELMNENKYLKDELATLRDRFKHELSDKELSASYHRLNVPVTNFPFSSRAQKAFAYSKIKTLNDLASLTFADLKRLRNIGSLTAKEIGTKALELGIRIE
jgi:hypothetical protein